MMHKESSKQVVLLLGPAFVAAVAYVDPGNFAANFGAGAKYGFLLLWVLVLANSMAALAQYTSAKVGLVTGKSLPELVAERMSRWGRRLYWAQAELVAVATDIAEVVGGAVALNLLFGLQLPIGGLIIGIVSMALLGVYSHHGQKYFERLIVGLLLIIPLGFFVGLVQHPPNLSGVLSGLTPRFGGQETLLLATAMIGATIMPHVVYLHSALARDRHGKVKLSELQQYLKVTKIDVGLAMLIAGTVNIAMLLLAAAVLGGATVEGFGDIFEGLSSTLGPLVAVLFAVGLLVSGLASTAVGSQAGSVIMKDLVHVPIPLWIRRLITMIPALFLLILGIDPLLLLVISQVALSFGVPFALIPLSIISSNRNIMGAHTNSRVVSVLLYTITASVAILNMALIWLMLVPGS
ncbi:putative manganese transport protein mntH [Candidatus Saccharimonas aalborgensis]|jgi:manganese transport protein|uniref:Putative manganese transport protein mntH n=1 Tax=Candidatus Saccharimonas aalborgensis TaxID=1332188 RepID=R4PX05_9BACT|nr:Nramp family divalent metal transporter [Candidatus Saccharimonas aalborgensis]AGL62277.1 putative manganese transport protein mntH [Candidatus Saccharimonas aalborgensis]